VATLINTSFDHHFDIGSFSQMEVKLCVLFVCVSFVAGLKSVDISCDVVIAGGSTAALASTIAIARQNENISVCLLEPTDWPGCDMRDVQQLMAVIRGPTDFIRGISC